MSAQKNSQNPLRYDVRLVDRNLRKGELTWSEQGVHLDELPDVSDKAVVIDEERLLREAHGAADRMRERLKTQPLERRRTLPVPTTSFEDEEYGSITPEDEVEEDEDE